ncbi:MAG TPA: 7-cyano-7-deazaguanine synthase QueC [Acetivibrio sp.]|jgi:7-cyano-7-deazaguanine synthase|nr:7-cyano-7-deazaguanine synthase QueC [Clostridium sp.]HOQ37372.1 7-cyano-7-deazaguanine synthase QueC [Acetivibrio sp.]HPT91345.1 7-cyano-7-deazaguanine synthase QueC [Acetivibrio sp.]HQA58574.1 7-cyano-7-deazaguanine synthase QueC [Acetivibrio sp.]
MKKAVVLLSGGLDSTTCLSVALKDGYEVYPLSFDYGQRHYKELDSAKKVVKYYNIKTHKIVKMGNVGGSALTDADIDVPDYKGTGEIPVTYVPARNIVFLSYAAGYAEVVDAEAIYIGVNSVDYSGYPDCRPEFIEAFEKVIKVGTKRGVEGNAIKIVTPLINLSKAEIIKLAYENNAPLHLTTSCYRGEEKACGVCDSCVLRLKGFKEAGIVDTIEYMK